jgi:hypothetical protein
MDDFNSLKAEYDALLDKATTETNQSDRDADIARLMILKQKMADAITSSLGSSGDQLGEKRQVLLAELARIQYDYNGMLESDDKLKTLKQIRDYQQGKIQPISFSMYEIGLGLASLLLLALIVIRR